MSETPTFTEVDATIYPTLTCDRVVHDVSMTRGQLRLAADAIVAGRVALIHFDDCIVLEPDSARKLLEQLKGALGERHTQPPAAPLPWTTPAPNPYVPWTPPQGPTCDGSSSAGQPRYQVPRDTLVFGDAGRYECESEPPRD